MPTASFWASFPQLEVVPVRFDVFVNASGVNHVENEPFGTKQVSHIDVHHGLQKERKLNDPQVEMLAQTKSVGKGAVDERVKWLNYHVEIKHDGNYRQQTFRAEKPAIETADVKRHRDPAGDAAKQIKCEQSVGRSAG